MSIENRNLSPPPEEAKIYRFRHQTGCENEAAAMNLPKTSLNIVYLEPQIIQDGEEREQQLTKFITLFAQVGFRELALNENFASELDSYCK